LSDSVPVSTKPGRLRFVASVVPLAIVVAIVAFWLAVKSASFEGLSYTSDLFSAIQSSRSVFEGRSPLYDNYWGSAAAIHNIYILLLFMPLTVPLGAYGLFIGHACLLLLAAHSILRLAEQEPGKRLAYWALLVGVVFGPISFWMWDNPVYGWHPELLIAPLSILFGVALLKRERLAWLWAALLVSTHEIAPLVAGGVHLLVDLSDRGQLPRRALGRWIPRWFAIGIAWAAVFTGGLIVLTFVQRSTGNTVQSGRLGVAVAALIHSMSDTASGAAVLGMTISAANLLGACLLILTMGATIYRPALQLACLLPLWAVGLLSGMAYMPAGTDTMVAHGLTWPPRFVVLWSIVTIGLILSIHHSPVRQQSTALRRGARTLLALAGCAFVQVLLLNYDRGYSISSRLANLGSDSSLPSARLTGPENRFLRCLSDSLPNNTPVAVHGSLFARFHRHEIVWPNHVDVAAAAPVMVVCDANQRFAFENGCHQFLESVSPQFQLFRFQGLEAAATMEYIHGISECGGR